MRKTNACFLIGLAFLGATTAVSAQTDNSSVSDSNYYQTAKPVRVEMPNHLTSKHVHGVEKLSSLNQDMKSEHTAPEEVEHSVLQLTELVLEENANTSETSVESQPPVVAELQGNDVLPVQTRADKVFADVKMEFKPLPNRNIREATYESDPIRHVTQARPQTLGSRQPLLQSQAVLIKRQAEFIQQQAAFIQQQNTMTAQGTVLPQRSPAPWKSFRRQTPANGQQIINQFIAPANINEPNTPLSKNDATQEAVQQTSIVVDSPGQTIVQKVSYQDDVDRPTPEDSVTTYQWNSESQQLTQNSQNAQSFASSPNGLSDLENLRRMRSQQNQNDLTNYPMRDRLDFFRTEDSHTNVRSGAYENRDPFGAAGQKCCDEWEGLCKCKSLEYDCPCGGLKMNSGSCGESNCSPKRDGCGSNKQRLLNSSRRSCKTCAQPALGCNQCRPKAQLLRGNRCGSQSCGACCGCPKATTCTSCGSK